MPKLIALRGYSGSGKSTWAREWVAENRAHRLVTSRDDLRKSLFDDEGILSNDKELFISKIQKDIVAKALSGGIDVVVDNTNLRARYLREWADLASDLGADFEIKDFKTVPHTCVYNDAQRAAAGGRSVGEDVINDQARRFPIKNWQQVTARPKENLDITPYEVDDSLPFVVIVDIDGTVADFTGLRGPYDLTKVSGDLPKEEIIDIVRLLNSAYPVIFFSGREDVCYDDTMAWLEYQAIGYNEGEIELHMRKAGDGRPDSIVKYEMFQQYIRGKYNVAAVLDDRPVVCAMWRKLNVPLLQVGPGDSVQF